MSDRVLLTGIQPVVEYRSRVDRYFVTYPSVGLELVMAFQNKYTAREIAIQSYAGTPFFQMIPTVPYQTEYPRPGLAYPVVPDLEIQLRIVSG